MPKVRIHNRTKGSTFPKGVGIVISAGATNSQGVFQGNPFKLEVKVDESVHYDIPSSAFRIMAEPKNNMMQPANWAQQVMPKTDIDLYLTLVASNEQYGVAISVDEPASKLIN